MLSRPVLIADPDRHARESLPRILSEQIPQLDISTCSSAEEFSRKLQEASYGTVVMNPRFLGEYAACKYSRGDQILTPLIVIASPREPSVANQALAGNAFDVIVTPINPHEAADTVRLALWQHKLLRLLASRERASARFQQHMTAFPHAQKAQAEFVSKLAAYERTLHALKASLQLLLEINVEDERSLFDLAASVEQFTKQRAWDRLFHLCHEGPSHGCNG